MGEETETVTHRHSLANNIGGGLRRRPRILGTLIYQRVNSEREKEGEDYFKPILNPYPTAFPYGNGMVLHFYQQQESSTTKTVHKVINKGLKAYV